MGGKSGVMSIRCPHCGEPPGNEDAMHLFPGQAPWTCAECGREFLSPEYIPIRKPEDHD